MPDEMNCCATAFFFFKIFFCCVCLCVLCVWSFWLEIILPIMDGPTIENVESTTDGEKKKKKKRKVKKLVDIPEEKPVVEEEKADIENRYMSSKRLMPFASRMALTQLNHTTMSDDAEFDPIDLKMTRDDLKIKEGRYKIGEDQFLASKMLFIPGRFMSSDPAFNFPSQFTRIGLDPPPSIIFKLNRALITRFTSNDFFVENIDLLIDRVQSLERSAAAIPKASR